MYVVLRRVARKRPESKRAVDQNAARFSAGHTEALLLKELGRVPVFGKVLCLQDSISLFVLRPWMNPTQRRQTNCCAVGIQASMPITRHPVRGVIVKELAAFVFAKKVTDRPAALANLSTAPARDVLKRQADIPASERFVKARFDGFQFGCPRLA